MLKVDNDCPKCGAAPGELHAPGCLWEQCPRCGKIVGGCSCSLSEDWPPPEGDRIPWAGEFPGAAECREFGWYVKSVPGGCWRPCNPGELGDIPDLNRLMREAVWDRVGKRWRKPRWGRVGFDD
jgi:hypothetical protein